MKTKRLLIPLFVLVLMASVILLSGCEAEVDEDWTGFAPSALHPFENPPTANHGEYMVQADYPFDECTECHGTAWDGVDLEDGNGKIRSCYTCHSSTPHMGAGLTNYAQHASFLLENNYPFDDCLVCHTHYAMDSQQTFAQSCASAGCHDYGQPDLYDCNNCHGDRTLNPNDITLNDTAPPTDLSGNTVKTEMGVGAHQAHLATGDQFADVPCAACHIVPLIWNAGGHLDGDNIADVTFREYADEEWYYNAGETPTWDRNAGTCSATYCHGNQVPVWNDPTSGGGCGTCHDLPPANHADDYAINECYMCHGSVINENGQIYAGELHVNGTVNYNE